MRLTRRGQVVAALCVGSVFFGALFGARTLNAIVVSGAIVLLAGYLQLRSAPTPQLTRSLPPDGHVGESHSVTVTFQDSQTGDDLSRPLIGTLEDRVSDGLATVSSPNVTSIGTQPYTYTVEYQSRGEQSFGPLTLNIQDIFGVVHTQRVCRELDSCLVYPKQYPIDSWFTKQLSGEGAAAVSQQRDEFDRLRQYDRGDSLRDIHWATTAKRDTLVVKAFASDTQQHELSLSAGAVAGTSDALAEAVASISPHLVQFGVPVVVSLPDTTVTITAERQSLRPLLAALATVGPGSVPHPDADIVIDATADRTQIRVGDQSTTFTALRQPSDSTDATTHADANPAVGQQTSRRRRPVGHTGIGDHA